MLSIIIPFHNEEDNLAPLHEEIAKAFAQTGEDYEVILIDDGSTDKSLSVAHGLREKDKKVIVVKQRKKSGKGEAIRSGVKHAKGDMVVFMDADLQDDPADIGKFLKRIHEGYDLVNGIRTQRQDNIIVKFYSKTVNVFLKQVLHSPFTDINCGFKLFKKDILDEIALYGNNFRFLPLAAFYKGFKVSEVPVHNRQRVHGKSKYGIGKLFIGVIDTVTAYFLHQFSEQPLHFFGTIGAILFVPGFILTAYLAYERIFNNILLYRRPALLAGVLLIIVGLQIVMTGMIGELIVYTDRRKSKS